MNCRTVPLLMICFHLTVAAAALAAHLIPPADNLALRPVLDAIQAALKENHPETAATLVDGLLRDHAADLLSTDAEPGMLVSVSARVQALLKDGGNGLAGQYAGQFEAAAHGQLQQLQASGLGSAPAYYAIAQRYPATATAAAALALAGDAAAGTGDLPSALVYYHLAQSAGWVGDKPQQQRMAAAAAAMKNPLVYNGMILFNAPWYPNAKFAGQHYFPFASGGRAFLATSEHALAFSPQGTLLWSDAITAAPPSANRGPRQPWPPDWNRNTPVRINVLYAAGSPQVVVARGIGPDGTAFLVGLAASDGRRLWSTSDHEPMSHLSFQPSPALAGQYVYDLATDPDQQGTLLLLALNVSTGREMWRTNLGGEGFNPWQTIVLHYTEPAGIVIDEDQLILSPNVDCVIAADRFDGKIRWMNQNTGGNPPDGLPSGDTMEVLRRYDNTPYLAGKTVIVAGADGEAIHALDVTSGEQVWENGGGDHLPYSTLVGVSGNVAIVAAAEIDGLDCRSGWPLWRYIPSQPGKNNAPPVVLNGNGGTTWTGHGVAGRISGPPVIFNGKVYVPTTTGTRVLSALTGMEENSAAPLPDLRILLRLDAVREALTADHVLDSFTLLPANGKPAR